MNLALDLFSEEPAVDAPRIATTPASTPATTPVATEILSIWAMIASDDSTSVPGFSLTNANGYDVRATVHMLAFARALKRCGQGGRLTSGGRLDTRKAVRAANALLGRPASDKPLPSVAEWEIATVRGGSVFSQPQPLLAAFLALPCDPVSHTLVRGEIK